MGEIPVGANGRVPGKLIELQILRAVAASLVVVDHAVGELAREGVGGAGRYRHAADLVGHYGVSAFFVLSGLLMTRQSRSRFGKPGASTRFLWERLARIAPLYWLATLLTYWKLMNWNPALRIKRQLTLSLLFVPNFFYGNEKMYPLLLQGWTLNYEMFFYAAFALCLLLPWRWGVAALAIGMEALALAGIGNLLPGGWGLARFYCTPLLGLFAAGVLLGVLDREWDGVPKVRLWPPASLLVCVPAGLALGFAGSHRLDGGWALTHWLAVVAVAVCLLAREVRLGRVESGLARLGDASYATYLFHVFAVSQVGYWAGLGRLQPWLVVALMVVGANGLGLAVHWAVERPMTRGLKRLTLRVWG